MSQRLSIPLLAITLIALSLCLPAAAQAAFGLNEFDVSFSGQDGSPAVQAGSHPFAFTTALEANVSGEELQGRLRELFLDEMPGLLADPTAVPRCAAEDFDTIDEGVNDCPDSTAVGIFEGATGEAEDWTTSPVFNLVPPPGVLMRLGFRVANAANAIVDFELAPEAPYSIVASVGEFPQAAQLFGAQLQLWGVPASSAHDEFRGRCVVHGGSCPSLAPESAYLTLPTSCEGPQATYYDVLSWEGDEDAGYVFTHDNAEPPNPLGFGGCGKLAFSPAITVLPTSEAAESPSGLELVIDVSDDGLANPAGLTQSQIRDFILALPAGLTINPTAIEGLQYCTETNLAAETLGATPGEGCPEASKLGTIEVETPLAQQSLYGAVFAAQPFDETAPPNLYVVIKNHELGVIVKQLIEIEKDPKTGQLIAYAEDMPQLPFARLRLNLREDEGAPLVTPPQCAAYDGHDAAHEPIRANLTPWSGSASINLAYSFEILSGPNGSPCPTGAGKQEPPAAPNATSAGAIPSDTTPPSTIIRKSKLRRQKRIAVFTFGSSESGSRFLCKLDRERPARCSSPQTYIGLKSGRHRFEVWAIDAAGRKDPTPAVVRFKF